MDFIPMEEAFKEAAYGIKNSHGGPFGAVIVYENKIISRGHNQVIAKNDPTAHAEMEAIRNACSFLGRHNLSDAVLYTTCYPCPMCMGAILWARIAKVYYCINSEDVAQIGFNDDKFYCCINDEKLLHELYTKDETLRNSCLDLLKNYAESPHQIY